MPLAPAGSGAPGQSLGGEPPAEPSAPTGTAGPPGAGGEPAAQSGASSTEAPQELGGDGPGTARVIVPEPPSTTQPADTTQRGLAAADGAGAASAQPSDAGEPEEASSTAHPAVPGDDSDAEADPSAAANESDAVGDREDNGTGSNLGNGALLGSAAFDKLAITVDLQLNIGENDTIITITGPADKWFGVGFGALNLADHPYTLVADGTGKVEEWTLDDHGIGAKLATTSWKEVPSSAVVNGQRVVFVTRSSRTDVQPSEHFDFTTFGSSSTLNLIAVEGSTSVFTADMFTSDTLPVLNIESLTMTLD